MSPAPTADLTNDDVLRSSGHDGEILVRERIVAGRTAPVLLVRKVADILGVFKDFSSHDRG